MKPYFTLEVNNISEFQELVNKKDIGISQAIVGALLKNLKTKRKNILAISINCKEEGEIFDLTIERKHIKETLLENLKLFEEKDMFEDCIKIKKAISELED